MNWTREPHTICDVWFGHFEGDRIASATIDQSVELTQITLEISPDDLDVTAIQAAIEGLFALIAANKAAQS